MISKFKDWSSSLLPEFGSYFTTLGLGKVYNKAYQEKRIELGAKATFLLSWPSSWEFKAFP